MSEKQNKVVLITGATRGIGAATVRLFAHNGFNICINYHKSQALAEELVNEVESMGRRCIGVCADVSVEADVINLFEQVDKQLGRLDCLVNNAGILLKQSPVVDMTAERINKILITNVTSQLLCAKEAIKRMAKSHGGEGGTIVNVSSGASRTGSPNEYIDYAASKGAVDTFTIGLAKEVAAEGIRVNCVRPGVIYTDMHADGGEPGRVERLKDVLPLKRGGKPEEVAEAIYWLASNKSSFTTGSFIDVTGGL